jgi:phenylpropionate dioxygenase-like ring-hydroxylating dioxygenase large terminal subunit
MKNPNGTARALIDIAAGEISREIFVDDAIYRQEQERIFARAWLYVGHESQIRSPGDFLLSKMGEESVIVARDRSNRIRVMLNTCRHRGMKVCRYDEGNTTAFQCPYHGWTYALDGKLTGVQQYEKAYQPPFDKEDWGLVEASQIASFRGMIWATWDAGAPPFDEYLGEAKFALDIGFRPWDGGESETEVLGSIQKWLIPSNWKIVAENFAGDILHNVSHRSVDIVGVGPNEKSGRRDEPGRGALGAYPEGHGIIYTVLPPTAQRLDYSASPATAAYFQECWKKRVASLGEKAGVSAAVGTIFPNMSFHAQQPRTILVAHPRGAHHTEMWRTYIVDKDAPAEVKQFLRSYYIRYSGPAGLTEQDDMENWNYATAASDGFVARRYPYNYKAGTEPPRRNPLIPGQMSGAFTERNARALYNRWAEYMDAKSWDDLSPASMPR